MNERRKAAIARSIIKNDEPSLTDQSQANETRIHTIVKRATVSGQVPTNGKEAQYLDWTNIPTNLVDMIQLARQSKELRSKLPKQLRGLTDQQLHALTYEQLNAILNPPKPKPAEPDPKDPKPDDKEPKK